MKTLLLLSFLYCYGFATAQQNLPKGLTENERHAMGNYYKNYFSNRGISTPPSGDLRCAAEWEEVQTLVITWTGQYNGIHSQIVDAAQEECEVLIACSDSTVVKNALSANGVPFTNVSFLEVDYNSVWIRDYAGNTIYKNDVDSVFLVDWIYNRPRPDDDAMPDAHAQFKGIPLYETTAAPTDLVNTGGNWMSDGFGTAFASELILEENELGNPYSVTVKSELDVDNIVDDWMGISRYIKMPTLPYDNIHHIDMHMKLLDEETLLVSEYPAGVADGPQIEANIQYVLSNYTSVFGTPYKVKKIVVPPSTTGQYPDNNGYYRTYSNQVFVNKTILLPIYREEYDTIAFRVLKELLPGYKIVGIDVDNAPENLIAYSGAIHCITHSIGVDDPLLISHQPLHDTYDQINPYQVDAYMKHVSGISSATLYWSVDTAVGYNTVSMNLTSTDNYTGFIPAQTAGSEVFYYVKGDAVNGKQQVRPIVAPTGYWKFAVNDTATNITESTYGIELLDPFPNPASAITCIPVTAQFNTKGSISLMDVAGKVVTMVYEGDFPVGESKYFIHANEYAAGSYFVVVKSGNATSTKKLMIR